MIGALLLLLCVAGLFNPRTAGAHVGAIDVLANFQGQLQAYLYPSGLPLGSPAEFNYAGLSDRIVASDPGFGVLNASNRVDPDTVLNLTIVSPLLYFDGQAVVETASSVSVLSPSGVDIYEVDANSGIQAGMEWGTYNGDLFWDAHGFYFLSPNESASGLYAMWAEVDSTDYRASAPFLLPFIYDPSQQFTPDDIQDGFEQLLQTSTLTLGDFNHDGLLNEIDIDALSAAVRSPNADLSYDLNDDDLLDQSDRRIWVEELSSTYFGDSNLDLEFNSSDLVIALQSGQYEDAVPLNSSWATGDWNGDGDFGSGDLIIAFQSGGYEQGPRSAALAAVPEPRNLTHCISLILLCISYRKLR